MDLTELLLAPLDSTTVIIETIHYALICARESVIIQFSSKKIAYTYRKGFAQADLAPCKELEGAN